ncbi:hypothetical protein DFJ73DRAFT_900000 [Zopfochytrium polystomum]|nr:hypothetical protein DFJ73DRAFT_900000 [Zopfochytrium polystomum]
MVFCYYFRRLIPCITDEHTTLKTSNRDQQAGQHTEERDERRRNVKKEEEEEKIVSEVTFADAKKVPYRLLTLNFATHFGGVPVPPGRRRRGSEWRRAEGPPEPSVNVGANNSGKADRLLSRLRSSQPAASSQTFSDERVFLFAIIVFEVLQRSVRCSGKHEHADWVEGDRWSRRRRNLLVGRYHHCRHFSRESVISLLVVGGVLTIAFVISEHSSPGGNSVTDNSFCIILFVLLPFCKHYKVVRNELRERTHQGKKTAFDPSETL